MKKLFSVGAVVAVSTTLAANAEASEQHEVQSGDTLSDIANSSGTTVQALKEKNDLSSNIILPGQVLTVDGGTETVQAAAPEQAENGVYTIQSGDTLAEIAEKFDVTVQELKNWNNLSSDLIFTGKELTVSADSVEEVAVQETAQEQTYEEPAQEEQSQEPVQEQTYEEPAQNNNSQQEQSQNDSQAAAPTSSGGQDWGALAQCESDGNPNAVSPSGAYHGLYQFDQQTWESVGGTGSPSDASAEEQTQRAQQLHADRGAQPWPVCGANL